MSFQVVLSLGERPFPQQIISDKYAIPPHLQLFGSSQNRRERPRSSNELVAKIQFLRDKNLNSTASSGSDMTQQPTSNQNFIGESPMPTLAPYLPDGFSGITTWLSAERRMLVRNVHVHAVSSRPGAWAVEPLSLEVSEANWHSIELPKDCRVLLHYGCLDWWTDPAGPIGRPLRVERASSREVINAIHDPSKDRGSYSVNGVEIRILHDGTGLTTTGLPSPRKELVSD